MPLPETLQYKVPRTQCPQVTPPTAIQTLEYRKTLASSSSSEQQSSKVELSRVGNLTQSPTICDPEKHTIEQKVTTLPTYNRRCGTFSAKVPKFSLPWQHGSV